MGCYGIHVVGPQQRRIIGRKESPTGTEVQGRTIGKGSD